MNIISTPRAEHRQHCLCDQTVCTIIQVRRLLHLVDKILTISMLGFKFRLIFRKVSKPVREYAACLFRLG